MEDKLNYKVLTDSTSRKLRLLVFKQSLRFITTKKSLPLAVSLLLFIIFAANCSSVFLKMHFLTILKAPLREIKHVTAIKHTDKNYFF